MNTRGNEAETILLTGAVGPKLYIIRVNNIYTCYIYILGLPIYNDDESGK